MGDGRDTHGMGQKDNFFFIIPFFPPVHQSHVILFSKSCSSVLSFALLYDSLQSSIRQTIAAVGFQRDTSLYIFA
jgi:hypothetical protein